MEGRELAGLQLGGAGVGGTWAERSPALWSWGWEELSGRGGREKGCPPQGPWVLALKSLINLPPLGPQIDHISKESRVQKPWIRMCGAELGGGAPASSLLPPSPQQYLRGIFKSWAPWR